MSRWCRRRRPRPTSSRCSLPHCAPGSPLTVNGASKAYAMTGWRIGYIGGPKPIKTEFRLIVNYEIPAL